MEKIRIIVVEDDLLVQERIVRHLEIMGYDVSGRTDRGKEAIEIIESTKPDLILLDIELKEEMTGIDVAKTINEKWQIPVIFLTAFTDLRTITIAKKTNPANFLGKPYTTLNLRIAIDFALAEGGQSFGDANELIEKKDSFFVRSKDCYEKILVDNILFIEAANSSCIIMTNNSKKYVVSTNLTKLTRQFSHSSLIRVSRSHIINKEKVSTINGRMLILENFKIKYTEAHLDIIKQHFPIIKNRI